MKIININDINIKSIIDVLERGGLVVYPTETTYGIGVDATNPNAVKKLSLFKRRPLNKPYSIAVIDQKMAEKYVTLNNSAINLYNNFLPGPLTVVSSGKHKVAPGIESEGGTLGIRIPNYPLILKIIKNFKKPITATSANASYQKRPYKISDVLDNISIKQKSLIDLIIDAGELPHNEPSTVVDTTLEDTIILRQGDITFKNKDEVLSSSEEETQNIAKNLWQKYEKYKGQRAIVFALVGQMGAGKTQFTKGLARASGINDNILSPTYSLQLDYENKKNNIRLSHIDAWRMSSDNELSGLGFEQLIKHKVLIVIEWAEKVSEVIRKHDEEAIIIWVKIKYGKKENERLIKWEVI